MDRGMRRIQQQKASLDEMTSLLSNLAGQVQPELSTFGPSTSRAFPTQAPSTQKKFKPAVPEKNVLSPFQTINQERINPSKVEAISNMFETKPQGREPFRMETNYRVD